jgi:hypothetical protein
LRRCPAATGNVFIEAVRRADTAGLPARTFTTRQRLGRPDGCEPEQTFCSIGPPDVAVGGAHLGIPLCEPYVASIETAPPSRLRRVSRTRLILAKQLIIAEKPSVAADIARALGAFTRQGDYFESDHYVLSSAVGHLLEIGMPEEEEVKRGKWTFGQLPAIPTHFELKPIEKNEQRLRTLIRLIKRKDVTGLVNACDAGREGELIFRYIVQYAKTGKPIERLWLQSMTPASIRDGFARLRSDQTMRPLAASTARAP